VWESDVGDIAFLALSVGFFAALLAYLYGIERL
jgi:hypothetical protein